MAFKVKKGTTIEVEDSSGNTFLAFKIKKNLKSSDFEKFQTSNIADEDEDYIFNSSKNLIRVQKE